MRAIRYVELALLYESISLICDYLDLLSVGLFNPTTLRNS